MKRKGFEIQAKGDKTAEIYIYEDIGEGWFGGVSAKSFADDLKALGGLDTINVFINSYGGSVFDGTAIYNQLKRHSATVNVHVDGIAASIASIIAMAGDSITMAENGFMMIHNPWGMAMGTAEEMRKQADVLDAVRGALVDTYVARSTADAETISDMMNAETWLTAEDALAHGLVDSLTAPMALAASGDKAGLLNKYQNVPEPVVDAATAPVVEPVAELPEKVVPIVAIVPIVAEKETPDEPVEKSLETKILHMRFRRAKRNNETDASVD